MPLGREKRVKIDLPARSVESGPFRNDWAGRSLRQAAARITDYADTAGKRMADDTRLRSSKLLLPELNRFRGSYPL